MQHIRGTQTLAGTTAAGIICNGGQHFYTRVELYENGTANCWELVDPEGLQARIASGWLTCNVPSGKVLSIHGLGAYQIGEAQWLHDTQSYEKELLARLRSLNPDSSLWERPTSSLGELGKQTHSVPILPSAELYGSPVEGRSLSLFRRVGDQVILSELTLYADGRAALYSEQEEVYGHLDDVMQRLDRGELTAQLEMPARVQIPGLGTVVFTQALYEVEHAEKRKEIEEEMTKAQGGETAFEACKKAYVDYLIEPTERARQRLREAYEKVPEHRRMFLGSMDNKDEDYQRIIYFPEQKREV
ncbi:hypothetical protein B9G55_06415 [Saccharibacillus sp. O16]|nr:hypothetical protein B9G55_06415 [Saccharibacillus sp. O16]